MQESQKEDDINNIPSSSSPPQIEGTCSTAYLCGAHYLKEMPTRKVRLPPPVALVTESSTGLEEKNKKWIEAARKVAGGASASTTTLSNADDKELSLANKERLFRYFAFRGPLPRTTTSRTWAAFRSDEEKEEEEQMPHNHDPHSAWDRFVSFMKAPSSLQPSPIAAASKPSKFFSKTKFDIFMQMLLEEDTAVITKAATACEQDDERDKTVMAKLCHVKEPVSTARGQWALYLTHTDFMLNNLSERSHFDRYQAYLKSEVQRGLGDLSACEEWDSEGNVLNKLAALHTWCSSVEDDAPSFLETMPDFWAEQERQFVAAKEMNYCPTLTINTSEFRALPADVFVLRDWLLAAEAGLYCGTHGKRPVVAGDIHNLLLLHVGHRRTQSQLAGMSEVDPKVYKEAAAAKKGLPTQPCVCCEHCQMRLRALVEKELCSLSMGGASAIDDEATRYPERCRIPLPAWLHLEKDQEELLHLLKFFYGREEKGKRPGSKKACSKMVDDTENYNSSIVNGEVASTWCLRLNTRCTDSTTTIASCGMRDTPFTKKDIAHVHSHAPIDHQISTRNTTGAIPPQPTFVELCYFVLEYGPYNYDELWECQK